MTLIDNLEKINKSNKKLIFIHTPKCGGTYVSSILEYLKIKNNGHNQATRYENGITFTVIRDPINRFESLLNYRLDETTPRNDWPIHLRYAYKNKNITLNEIVSKMTNKEILGFSPYKTLTYWTKNVDIIITLEALPVMLTYFGYTYDLTLFNPTNVSNKTRGKLNKKHIDRIKNLYIDDVVLYNKITKTNL